MLKIVVDDIIHFTGLKDCSNGVFVECELIDIPENFLFKNCAFISCTFPLMDPNKVKFLGCCSTKTEFKFLPPSQVMTV